MARRGEWPYSEVKTVCMAVGPNQEGPAINKRPS